MLRRPHDDRWFIVMGLPEAIDLRLTKRHNQGIRE